MEMQAVATRTLRLRQPSQQRGTETVDALRDAAAGMLRTRDFSKISVADLARKAGIGVGTFYHFYPSKEALLLDLREQIFTRTMGELAEGFMKSPITDGKSTVAALTQLIVTLVEVVARRRGLERAVAAVSFVDPAFAVELRRQELGVQNAVGEILRGYAAGLRVADPDLAARMCVILVEAIVARSMREPDLAENPQPVAAEAARMMARYLLPPKDKVVS